MTGIGSAQLDRYLAGRVLTPLKSILAKCAECRKNYVEGKDDCKNPDCPLYGFMPYSSSPRPKSELKAAQARARFTRKKVRGNPRSDGRKKSKQ